MQKLMDIKDVGIINAIAFAWGTLIVVIVKRLGTTAINDALLRFGKRKITPIEARLAAIERIATVNRGFIETVARITVRDKETLEAIMSGFLVRNSDARINRERIRGFIETHGRPPAHIIETIREIVADPAVVDDASAMNAIRTSFSDDVLARAYEMHGGSTMAMTIFFHAIEEARRDGVDAFLVDLGLLEDPDV